jgi:hypothetical protein
MRILILVAGCLGPPLMVAGKPMAMPYWQKDETEVRQRAGFELNCPSVEVIPIVTVEMEAGQQYAKQVGVTGCGHRLVYVRGDYNSGWVLNSSDGAPK